MPISPAAEQVVIRAHGGGAAGAGHVMRCLALAHAMSADRAAVTFVLDDASGPLAKRVLDAGYAVVPAGGEVGTFADSTAVAALAAEEGARWVVVDGYPLGAEFVEALQAAGFYVLAIDDHGTRGYQSAEIVLDQNLGADPADYASRSARTRLLLGTEYALLRPEFARRRAEALGRAVPERAARLLVTFGGSDPAGLTALAIAALGDPRLEGIGTSVLLGPGAPVPDVALPAGVTLLRDVRDVATLIAETDLALAAAGSTCWELACLGVPSLLIAAAENQVPIAERMHAAGAGRYLGRADCGGIDAASLASSIEGLAADAASRRLMREAAARLVDGRGAARAEDARRDALVLRPATVSDAQVLLDWANDAGTREASFSAARIGIDEHARWLDAMLADERVYFAIASDYAGRPLGTIRFSVGAEQQDSAVVSVTVAPEFRRQGRATPLIVTGTQECFARFPSLQRVVAYVRPENEASARAFESAGYHDAGEEIVSGVCARSFVRDREAVK